MSTSASASKTTKKSTKVVEPVAASVVAAPAPVATATTATKTSKKAAATATTATAVVVPVAVAVAEPASPAVEAAADEDLGSVLNKAITRQQEINAQLKTLYSESSANLKTIEKLSARLAKKADRKRKNRKAPVEGAVAKPCIFTTPVAVSDELLAFLGQPKGNTISRSNVTKAISTYCKEHKLMNKQSINADAPLRKLLSLKEGDQLTILNLQKYLGRHYIKPAAPLAA
jgi:chromatin remodeling complex protein RSC6